MRDATHAEELLNRLVRGDQLKSLDIFIETLEKMDAILVEDIRTFLEADPIDNDLSLFESAKRESP